MKNSALFVIFASGLLFASCAGEEIPGYSDSDLNDTPPVVEEQAPDTDNPITENIPIEFEIPVSTLTKTTLDLEDGTTVNWQDGDKVGVFYRYTPKDGSATTASKACNVPYEYDAETGKFVAVDTPAYWDEGADAASHAMYVYYPYNENSTDVTAIAGSLPVEQNYDAAATQNSVASYGCYAGVARNIEYGKPVTFGSLYHQFGMMRLEIRNTTGSDIVIGKVQVESTKYIAGNFVFKMSSLNDQKIWPFTTPPAKKTVTINVANGAVAAGEAVDVRFLMRPGDCSGQTFNVTVTTVGGGETYTIDFLGVGTLIGGQRVAKPFNLTSPYNKGDVIGTDGVLFDISGDNLSGKVVYYINAANSAVKFSSDTTLVLDPASSSLDDGQANVEYLKSIDNTLEIFPAAKLCDDIAGDWYLPAIDELVSLFETYNGTTVADATYAKYVNLDGPEKESREAFNNKLAEIGGQKLDIVTNSTSGTAFLSSSLSTSDGSQAQYLRLIKAAIGSKALTEEISKCRVRCIKKVNFADLQNSTEE